MLTVHGTQCCGVTEIGNLRSFKDPKAAMISLCSTICTKSTPYANRATMKGRQALSAFYTFTAYNQPNTYQYGTRFEEFIREHKLGKVFPSEVRDNLKNYGLDHPIQIWIWAPDYDAVYDWWEKNDPAQVKRFRHDAPKVTRRYKARKVDGQFVIEEIKTPKVDPIVNPGPIPPVRVRQAVRTVSNPVYPVVPNKGSIYGNLGELK